MKRKLKIAGGVSVAALLLAACATLPSPAELDAQALAMMKASLMTRGSSRMSRPR